MSYKKDIVEGKYFSGLLCAFRITSMFGAVELFGVYLVFFELRLEYKKYYKQLRVSYNRWLCCWPHIFTFLIKARATNISWFNHSMM